MRSQLVEEELIDEQNGAGRCQGEEDCFNRRKGVQDKKGAVRMNKTLSLHL